ncbi:uncharacterized protein TNCV_4990851 [Trichonephila clavipes]|nr:uncharacterized protein TNCV_4990851 [Trichonephila clavipes]
MVTPLMFRSIALNGEKVISSCVWIGKGRRHIKSSSDTEEQIPNPLHSKTLKGLGSNPGEDMDVSKCIVPFRHEGTLNSRRAASPLMWLVEGVERWDVPDHPQVSSLKIGVETSQIVLSSVWCSKLRLKTGFT